MYAAMRGHSETAKVLLEYNAQPTICDTNGLSPIDLAVENRHAHVLRRLLDASDRETMNLTETQEYSGVGQGRSGCFQRSPPLFIACKVGSAEATRVLMEFIKPPGKAAVGISWAVEYNQPEVLRVLLQHPTVAANINQKDDTGNTPLFVAAFLHHDAIVRVLCANGADVTQTSDDIDVAQNRKHAKGLGPAFRSKGHSRSLTPLHGLAGFCNNRSPNPNSINRYPNHLYDGFYDGSSGRSGVRTRIARLLVKAGCNVNAKDSEGKTALFGWTAGTSQDSLLTVLLECGADARIRDNDGGTPLHARSLYAGSIAQLVQAGADVNAVRLSDGCTPIMAAKGNISEENLELITHGANPNHQDRAGNTVLHYLCHSGRIWVLRRLTSWLNVLDPTIKNQEGETCFHTFYGQQCKPFPEVIQYFVGRGFDLESRDCRGRTVLLAACAHAHGQQGLIYSLLECGVDVTAVDYHGKTCEICL
jgi:ankyrin repeat protein